MSDLEDIGNNGLKKYKMFGVPIRRELSLVMSFVNLIAVVTGGLYVAFVIAGGYDRRLQEAEANAKQREYVLERELDNKISADQQKIALMQEATRMQEISNKQWRDDVRDSLRQLNVKVEEGNRTLANMQTALANKVDRKP